MDYSSILSNFGITALNEMQKAAMEAIPEPQDVILLSPTGSGKTLGFLLPVLQLLSTEAEGVQVLILVPSRELSIQIEKVFKQMGTQFKINCCYGGHSVRIEENNLLEPPAVLVGTPGRIAHHLRKHNVSVRDTQILILDEFDKSLELGFKDEMEYIIHQCNKLEKRILTSATSLDQIPDFVGLQKSKTLKFTTEHQEMESKLELKQVLVPGDDKLEALMLLLGKLGSKSTIVFCNHRDTVSRISEQLRRYNIDHAIYHGGMEQIEREKALIRLRNGSVHFLITTDLASRGLDIPEIEAIVHYHLPPTEEIMIHRNGRTARMHANGTAYFILDEGNYLPPFLDYTPEIEELPKKMPTLKACEWKTIYIAGGKKDKISKADVAGMLLQKGELHKDELGKIEILDHSAYAAVKASKVLNVLQLVKFEKIKGKKYKIEIAS